MKSSSIRFDELEIPIKICGHKFKVNLCGVFYFLAGQGGSLLFFVLHLAGGVGME